MQAQSIKVFGEGDFVRWQIVDSAGAEYVDGGNYTRTEQALKGVAEALGMEIIEDDSISVDDAQRLAELAGIDPRPNDPDGFHWPYAPTFREVAEAWSRFE
jgi:hypothetical protein